MQTINNTWKKYDNKERIKNPKEIEVFLNSLIQDTETNLNIDFIDGGFADQLVKIEYYNPFFYLYWKDFSEEFNEASLGLKLTEDEESNLTDWGGNTFLYQLISIEELVVFELEKHAMIGIKSSYIKEKEILKELNRKYNIAKSEIVEVKIDFSSFREFIFQDENGRNHSCQYIQLPNFNLLIQDKISPLSDTNSQKVLKYLNLDFFNNKLLVWREEINSYEDFYDTENLTIICFEIRLYTEKLLKFLLTNLIKVSPLYEDSIGYDLEIIKKKYKNLLDQYGYNYLGDLRKIFSNAKVDIDIPEASFIRPLNTFSHETGEVPRISDVKKLIDEFSKIKEQTFDLLGKI